MGKGKTREKKSRRTITRPCVILAVVIVAVVSMLALVSCAHDGYTLVFNVDGQVTTSLEVKAKEEVVLPDPAAKDGYTFAGWYFDNETFADPCTAATLKDKKLKGENTIYAKWTKNEYTIKYEPNGGVNAKGNPSGYAVDTATIKLVAPTKVGYTFAGWFGKADFTDKAVTEIAKGSIGNKTFYAKWTAVDYTITYDLDNGTNSLDNPSKYTIENAITLANPTKVGYTFDGWYSEDTFATKVTEIAKGSTGNKTFYAKWNINSYTITYDTNGGGTITDTTYDILTMPSSFAAPAAKLGYTFAAWYDNAAFEGSPITAITIENIGNKTLFAKWTKDNYTITYELNGGSGNHASNPTTYAVDTATITLNAPTHANNWMTFGGWYGQADFKDTAITEIATGSTGNKTFYAKWIFTGTPGLTYAKSADNLAYEVSSSTATGAICIPSMHEEAGETLPVNIAASAFKNNTTITSVVIEEGVKIMGFAAFNGCTALTSVVIPDSVTSLGRQAFAKCSKLVSFTIPNTVTTIDDAAFWDCRSLISMNIPNSVTSIGQNAFQGCSNLGSIYIPNSVDTMGVNVFYGCLWVSVYCEIASAPTLSGGKGWEANWYGEDVDPTTEIKWSQILSTDGLIYEADTTTYKVTGSVGLSGAVTIPAKFKERNVTSLDDKAFFFQDGITSVVIPNTVTTIGSVAFWNCSSLTSIFIPSSVTTIGKDAFYGCTALTISCEIAEQPATGWDAAWMGTGSWAVPAKRILWGQIAPKLVP